MASGFHKPRFSEVSENELCRFVKDRKIVKFSDLCRAFSEYNDARSLEFFRAAADKCGYAIWDYHAFIEPLKIRRNGGLLKEVYSLIFPGGKEKGNLSYLVILKRYHEELKQRSRGDGLEANIAGFMEKKRVCSFEELCSFCGLRPGRRALERLRALGDDCGYALETCEDFLHLLNASGNREVEAQACRLLVPFKKKGSCFVAVSKKIHDTLKKRMR